MKSPFEPPDDAVPPAEEVPGETVIELPTLGELPEPPGDTIVETEVEEPNTPNQQNTTPPGSPESPDETPKPSSRARAGSLCPFWDNLILFWNIYVIKYICEVCHGCGNQSETM